VTSGQAEGFLSTETALLEPKSWAIHARGWRVTGQVEVSEARLEQNVAGADDARHSDGSLNHRRRHADDDGLHTRVSEAQQDLVVLGLVERACRTFIIEARADSSTRSRSYGESASMRRTCTRSTPLGSVSGIGKSVGLVMLTEHYTSATAR
jgi:hypothetical protein